MILKYKALWGRKWVHGTLLDIDNELLDGKPIQIDTLCHSIPFLRDMDGYQLFTHDIVEYYEVGELGCIIYNHYKSRYECLGVNGSVNYEFIPKNIRLNNNYFNSDGGRISSFYPGKFHAGIEFEEDFGIMGDSLEVHFNKMGKPITMLDGEPVNSMSVKTYYNGKWLKIELLHIQDEIARFYDGRELLELPISVFYADKGDLD